MAKIEDIREFQRNLQMQLSITEALRCLDKWHWDDEQMETAMTILSAKMDEMEEEAEKFAKRFRWPDAEAEHEG